MMKGKWRILRGHDVHAALLCVCIVPVIVLACIVWARARAQFLWQAGD
jgi:hypothetical protein